MITTTIVNLVLAAAPSGEALQNSPAVPAPTAQVLPSSKGVFDRPMTPDQSESGLEAHELSAGDPFEDMVESFKQFRSIESPDGGFRLNSDLWLTQDYFVFDRPPPALIQTGESQTYWPSLSGLLSMEIGEHFSFVALGQVYRGFDPVDLSPNANLDEYFAVVKPFDTDALILKGGTFATCYGQWVNRHFSFQSPLINAPYMYEGMTSISDGAGNVTASPTRTRLIGRKDSADPVTKWVPIIWGPSYTSGGQIAGTVQNIDYAVEVKNASLSSRPSNWEFWDKSFQYPTVTARLGWRPDAAWNLGVSGSRGNYLTSSPTITATAQKNDGIQSVVGTDISYAHGSVELWGEFAWSQWQVPYAENLSGYSVSAYSYFIEGKWKFAPQFWLAGRWNQQLYGDIDNPAGGTTSWDNDVWRIDACIGWKIDRFVQFKTQYSYIGQDYGKQQGSNLFAIQLVVEF